MLRRMVHSAAVRRSAAAALWLTASAAAFAGCADAASEPTAPPPATGTPTTPTPTTPTPTAPTRGMVAGTVRDAAGRPIAGAQVVADNVLYQTVYVLGTTDADGRYRINLGQQIGGWRVNASLLRPYNGRTYRVPLHPDTDAAFAGVDGAVRHFTWRLTGETHEGTRYGVRAWVYINESPDRTVGPVLYRDVEVTFTPVGPLIDGSAGQPVVVRLDDGFRVQDLPLGRYAVTARWLPAGGAARAMAVRVRDTGAYTPMVVADWPADSDGRIDVLELEARVP